MKYRKTDNFKHIHSLAAIFFISASATGFQHTLLNFFGTTLVSTLDRFFNIGKQLIVWCQQIFQWKIDRIKKGKSLLLCLLPKFIILYKLFCVHSKFCKIITSIWVKFSKLVPLLETPSTLSQQCLLNSQHSMMHTLKFLHHVCFEQLLMKLLGRNVLIQTLL